MQERFCSLPPAAGSDQSLHCIICLQNQGHVWVWEEEKKTWSIISNSPTSWTPDCCVRSACVRAGRLGSGTKEAAGSAARLHNQKPAGGFLQPTWDLPEDSLPWVLPKCCSRFPSSLEKLNYIQCVFIGRMKLYFPVLEIAMRDTFFS